MKQMVLAQVEVPDQKSVSSLESCFTLNMEISQIEETLVEKKKNRDNLIKRILESKKFVDGPFKLEINTSSRRSVILEKLKFLFPDVYSEIAKTSVSVTVADAEKKLSEADLNMVTKCTNTEKYEILWMRGDQYV
jgi:hypothetical protein